MVEDFAMVAVGPDFFGETLTNFDWPDRAGGSNRSLVLEVDESTLVQHILSRNFFVTLRDGQDCIP